MQIILQKKALSKDLVFLFFCLAIFSLPLSVKISSLCLVLGSISWCGFVITDKKLGFKNINQFWIILLWFSYHIISLLYSSNLQSGLFSIEKRLSILFLPLVFSTFHFKKKNIHWFLKIFIFSLFISTLICYAYAIVYRFQIKSFNHLKIIDWGYFSYSLTEVIGFHHVYYALYIVWGISILLYWLLFLNTLNTVKKSILIFLSLYFIIFAIILSSRTALVALIILLLVFIIIFIIKTKKYITAILIILAVLSIATISYQNVPYLSYKFENIITHGLGQNPRGTIIPLSIEIIKDNLIFGVGIGDTWNELMQVYEKYDYQEGLTLKYNVHNQYLHTLLWGGLLGIFLLSIHIIFTIIHALKRKQILYLIFLFLFWFCCISEVMLATQKGVVLYAFFTSIFLFTDYGINKTESI